jgi:hypothetical protein
MRGFILSLSLTAPVQKKIDKFFQRELGKRAARMQVIRSLFERPQKPGRQNHVADAQAGEKGF